MRPDGYLVGSRSAYSSFCAIVNSKPNMPYVIHKLDWFGTGRTVYKTVVSDCGPRAAAWEAHALPSPLKLGRSAFRLRREFRFRAGIPLRTPLGVSEERVATNCSVATFTGPDHSTSAGKDEAGRLEAFRKHSWYVSSHKVRCICIYMVTRNQFGTLTWSRPSAAFVRRFCPSKG